jgi:hypothetical protein
MRKLKQLHVAADPRAGGFTCRRTFRSACSRSPRPCHDKARPGDGVGRVPLRVAGLVCIRTRNEYVKCPCRRARHVRPVSAVWNDVGPSREDRLPSGRMTRRRRSLLEERRGVRRISVGRASGLALALALIVSSASCGDDDDCEGPLCACSSGRCVFECGDGCIPGCSGADDCVATCGQDCAYSCVSSSNCAVECGARCSVQCDGTSTCHATCGEACSYGCRNVNDCAPVVGEGSQVICESVGNCNVTCQGTCSVECRNVGNCNVHCPTGSPTECAPGVWSCGVCGG